jgi:hypothetical protein
MVEMNGEPILQKFQLSEIYDEIVLVWGHAPEREFECPIMPVQKSAMAIVPGLAMTGGEVGVLFCDSDGCHKLRKMTGRDLSQDLAEFILSESFDFIAQVKRALDAKGLPQVKLVGRGCWLDPKTHSQDWSETAGLFVEPVQVGLSAKPRDDDRAASTDYSNDLTPQHIRQRGFLVERITFWLGHDMRNQVLKGCRILIALGRVAETGRHFFHRVSQIVMPKAHALG